MENNISNNNNGIANEGQCHQPKNTITLLDGRTLACYPKAEPGQPIDNSMRLDTSGQFLVIGRKKRAARPKPQPEIELAEKFFTDHAFFFLDHRERILSDSRMFLAPVPIRNVLAYFGGSVFQHPTLGVYIEWWMTCRAAFYGDSCEDSWLVYRMAGSPLSGMNTCSSVNGNGICKSESIGDFSLLWGTFSEINKRYDEAKANCEAHSLEEVVEILETENDGGHHAERKMLFLQHENSRLRNGLQVLEDRKKYEMGKLHSELLRLYFKGNEEALKDIYDEYCRVREECNRKFAEIRQERQTLREQLQAEEIGSVCYNQRVSHLNNVERFLKTRARDMACESLKAIIPDIFKCLSFEVVIAFLEDKFK